MALGCWKCLRASLLGLLLVSGLLFVFSGVSQSGGKGAQGRPAFRATGLAPETGEMDPQLEAALNAFGAGRYEECRKLAEEIVGRAFPRPPLTEEDAVTAGGHRNTRPTPDTIAECVGLIILSHLQQGDFDAARAAVDRLRTISPEVCQDLLAQVSREERDYNARITRLQAIVATATNPEEAAKAQLLTARTHQMWGRTNLALESYGKVVKRWPDSGYAVKAVSGAAYQMMLAGQNDEAVESLLRQIIADYPATELAARAQLTLAAVYQRQGKSELVEQALITTVKEYPASLAANMAQEQLTTSYYTTARACEGKDDLKGAIVAWDKVLEYDRDDTRRAETMLRIVQFLICQGEYEQSLSYLYRLLDDPCPGYDKWREPAEISVAVTYYEAGDLDNALIACQKVAASVRDESIKEAAVNLMAQIERRQRER